MKRKFFSLSLFSLAALFVACDTARAQAVGIGTSAPHPSSMLDISSSDKGLLIPRMTLGNRNGISSPETGLLIFQTDNDPGFYYYNNGWQPVGAASALMANRTLSNLTAPTAINTDLLPGTSGVYHLGSAALSWQDIYFSGDILFQGSRFLSARGNNVFLGRSTGNPATIAFNTTAVGSNALAANVIGNFNSAFGEEALYNCNNGFSNSAVGYQSLISNTSGTYNTAVGVLSLNSNSLGSGNSAVGLGALGSSTEGYNSAFGYFAGSQLPSGNYNTYVGSFADGPAGIGLTNATAIGYQAFVTGSNMVKVGNTSVTSIGGYAGWTNFSDGRFKNSVKENVPGLAFINRLRAVTYNLDVDAIDKALQPTYTNTKNSEVAGSKPAPTPEELKYKKEKAKIVYTGFIAQEVEAAAKGLGYQFSGVDAPKTANGFYGLRYAEFTVPLVQAVQELSDKVESLQKESNEKNKLNASLEMVIQKQEAKMDKQQKEIDALKAMMFEMQKQAGITKSVTTK